MTSFRVTSQTGSPWRRCRLMLWFMNANPLRLPALLASGRKGLIPAVFAFEQLLALNALGAPGGERYELGSPDARIQMVLQMPAIGSAARPAWSATFQGKPLLTN